jgi:hypothetical protein
MRLLPPASSTLERSSWFLPHPLRLCPNSNTDPHRELKHLLKRVLKTAKKVNRASSDYLV